MQIEDFSKAHTAILPTLRGHPPSDVPLDLDAYDGNVMAGDLVALLDHLGLEKAVFAGGDVGGIIVQKLAFLHPERLPGLVIFNMPILGTMMHLIHHDPEQQELSKYSLKYIKHSPGDAYDLGFVCRTITDPEYRAEIKECLQKSPEGGMFYFFRKNFPAPRVCKSRISQTRCWTASINGLTSRCEWLRCPKLGIGLGERMRER